MLRTHIGRDMSCERFSLLMLCAHMSAT